MAGSAPTRFWRGVREPWELLGRMRQDRPLWSRYWRTVLVQAGLTLVAGLAIFWVGKQGAEAWNDAFGPEEPAATSTAPATAATSSAAPGGATAPSVPAPRAPAAPTKPSGPAPSPPARPAPPPPAGQLRGAAATPPAAGEERAAVEEAPADDEDAEDAADTGLEAQIEALKNATPEERGKRTAELVAAAVARAQKEAGRAERAGKRKGTANDAATELADDREAVKDTLEEVALAAEVLARAPPRSAGAARKARRHLERKLDEVEKEAAALERKGAPPLSAAERAQLERARAALMEVRRHERGLAGRLGAVLALLAAIYASLGIAQTGVLALSRDFHDALSRELSLLVQVAPEDPPMRPKIRLDLPWVRRKANRRAQFFLGFLPGQALISAVGWLVPPHRTLTSALTAVWLAYWWMVMTAGQSARAWSPPETTPRPWYLRAWFFLTDRVFVFRWWVPRAWGRIWERMARRFYGPSARVEEQPLEFAGLGLSRALILVPVVKLLLRPVFPVAAAHLLVEHAATARLPVAVTAAEVADAASHAPDPETRARSGAAAR